MATKWMHSTPFGPLPPNAVVGGYDCDGSTIYVGRSFHEGIHLPVKVIPSKRAAYVSWAGAEHAKSHYELLVGENYTWQPCFEANIPPNAIRTGETVDGNEPLFIGRGHYGNSLVVGKIQPSHACLYVPFAGDEKKLEKYEVLVYGGAAAEEGDLIKFEDHKWLHSSAYAKIPPNAVVGGNDVDGDMIYVGRAFHEGDMLVAKVIPAKQIAFVSFRGAEIPKDHYEILCGNNLVWRHCYNHIIPEKAVLCGTTSLGQPVYIGRGHYEGSLTVGKISSVHKALFIPFKGVERRLETYEILVEEKLTPGWQLQGASGVLPSAPPTAIPENPCIYPPIQTPYPYPDIKPAMPMPLEPPPPYTSVVTTTPMPMPMPSVSSTFPTIPPVCRFPKPAHNYPTATPAETYAGPTQHFPNPPPPPPFYATVPIRPYNVWVSAHPGTTPGNAVHAGHDVDMSTIYVCRAHHNGDLMPGKAIPGRASAYVSYQGQEIPKTSYEMLLGEHYIWVPAVNGFAAGAVEAGHTTSGEPLFVGRAHYSGSLTCGKIQRSHNCLYIPFGGREVRISHGYEILVDRTVYKGRQAAGLIY